MSLDDPGLGTVPVDSNSDDHREQRRPDQDDTAVDHAGDPSDRPRTSPDELIALAEQEQADRRAVAGAARVPPAPAPAPAAAPAARPGPRRTRKRKARKVRRIVRRLDAWSILKVSLLFFFCVYLIAMVAGVLLWNAAQQAGTIEGFEGFIADLGAYETFTFEGDQLFNGALLGGLVLVIAASAGSVLLAVLFNLISDLTGGIRVTVIEEEQALAGRDRRAPAPPAAAQGEPLGGAPRPTS
jgi:hypothetical protein